MLSVCSTKIVWILQSQSSTFGLRCCKNSFKNKPFILWYDAVMHSKVKHQSLSGLTYFKVKQCQYKFFLDTDRFTQMQDLSSSVVSVGLCWMRTQLLKIVHPFFKPQNFVFVIFPVSLNPLNIEFEVSIIFIPIVLCYLLILFWQLRNP